MSGTHNIETPHERRPFKDHGHMDVVTLVASPSAVECSSPAGAGRTT